VEAGHLGGYVAGGDPATYYPELWDWLVKEQGVKSVLDVGCGDGVALDYFAGLGCATLGVEGTPQDHPRIERHDYTLGSWPSYPLDGAVGPFDLVWCCEFVEHVEERYVPNFLWSFKLGRLLLMTHAEPGQAGYHHVNCRERDYWVGALAAAGFALDLDFTGRARSVSRANASPWNHFARSGLAFRNLWR
jgi:SAM-dependent methyltransferase